ncbi:MAG: hypothetical protein GY827_05965 [Cytophagales bacterium]|nr:hypothetical protein [Cytophagales bacterium]
MQEIYYKQNPYSAPIILGCIFLFFIQVFLGSLISPTLIYSASIYIVVATIYFKFQKKESFIIFNEDNLQIEGNHYSWNDVKGVSFIVQKNEQQEIIHCIELQIEKESIIINQQEIKDFSKTAFEYSIKSFQDAYKKKIEKEKGEYTLSPIEEKLQIQYPSLLKEKLEKNNQKVSIQQIEFTLLSSHKQEHSTILELSKLANEKIDILQNNAIAIAQNQEGFLFILINELSLFYSDFNANTPPVLIYKHWNKLFEDYTLHKELNDFETLQHELPEEKGIIKFRVVENQKNNASLSFQYQEKPFANELILVFSCTFSMDDSQSIFEYEAIFLDYNKQKEYHPFLLHNLKLSTLKFTQQAWISKGLSNEEWEKVIELLD